ncbi:TetR/AcrR family transcriptional regulator [Agromyces sp. Marseille-P2726]|uniref:TetR/AcrR family transcriptional regulator n=1 Tax=Agromyces sp. Marseille-P2726 TaxID=2709132 RepID=UPI001570DE8E|nr:TetR/AcrR family transcriptional regulator [Agromyces sp. Marseille-P2726]
MATRGAYAKGVAKREEILTTALDVIARNGYRHASVRELADAVGLSQAGLLHYFSSKEELFAEVLRKRDEVDLATYGAETGRSAETFFKVIAHNAEVPGLVQLYAQLALEAVDPAHPAHAYFVRRADAFRDAFADLIREEQDAGRCDPDLEPTIAAGLIMAAADGLQTQWLLDPSIDMVGHLMQLWRLLTGARADAESPSR